MTTTWDPNAESGMTLSNNDLTATVISSWTDGMSVRSTTSQNSGKYYLEFSFGQVAYGFTYIGCANSSWDYDIAVELGRDANSFTYQSDGSIFVANGNPLSYQIEGYAAGDIVQLCVDFGAKLFWVTKNNDGNWNGASADPAAGTGGFSFSAISGPFFVGYCSAISGDNSTVNFGASTFSYSAPTGYLAWDGQVAPPETTSTWDPNAESGMTLSNSDLTATTIATWTDGTSVRSTTSRNSGQAYVEFTFGQVAYGFTHIGCGNASWNYNVATSLGRDANSFAYQSDGYIFIAGSNPAVIETYSADDVVQLCVDFDAQLFWVTKNDDGNWNGTSADPATGTGGVSFSGVPGPSFFVGYTSPIAGDNCTVNLGGSAFIYSPPTGFGSWGNTSPPTTVTTWDPNATSGLMLSSSNLTVSVPVSGLATRSTTSQNSGKAYIELNLGQVSPNGETRIGCANSSWNYTQYEQLGYDTNSFAYGSDGNIYVADTRVGSGDSFGAGDTIQLCVDFDAQKLWATKNNDGDWNGTDADPAAGTGGFSFSSISGPFFLAYCSAIPGDNSTANFGASAFMYTPPTGFSAWNGSGGGITPSVPAALADYSSWIQYKNWNFGSNTGNNIQSLSDFTNAGWGASGSTVNNPSVEEQTFYTGSTLPDDCPNFIVYPDHVDIVAIWNGGEIATGSNGNITSIQTGFPVDTYCSGLTSIAYIEGTFQCPNVSGAWPAWWTIGHQIGQAYDYTTWGPEIDIMEVQGPSQISDFLCSLHAADDASNQCFMSGSGANIPPGTVDYTGSVGTVTYQTNGAGNWNLGDFEVNGVVNASNGFHRYGCLIEPDYTISMWIDDVKIGHFAATQYCDDSGTPVALQLLIDLALSSASAGNISSTDFGGANNTSSTNLFRLSIRNIQIWGPTS